MRLILITHAHTAAVPAAAADGWRLSATGEAQAAALARAPFWADVTQIVVSSEPKTHLTVDRVVRDLGLPVRVECRFDELRRNGWVPAYADAVAAALLNPTASHLGWEPAAAALRRGLDGIADLTRRSPEGTVAIVGHGLQISLLRAHWLGQARVNLHEWARLPFAGVAQIELPKGLVVADFPYSMQARA